MRSLGLADAPAHIHTYVYIERGWSSVSERGRERDSSNRLTTAFLIHLPNNYVKLSAVWWQQGLRLWSSRVGVASVSQNYAQT